MGSRLDRGREAFEHRRWAEAYRLLGASSDADLDPADCERLAVAAYLVGNDDESATAWESAYRGHLQRDDVPEAARCSFWLAFALMMRGRFAGASGWLSRAEGLLERSRLDCVAAGYVLIPPLLTSLGDGDAPAARGLAQRAIDVATRFDDPDLNALAVLGYGQALLALGELGAGVKRFDEVMLSVTTGEVSPVASGVVYCAVILECMNLLDLARAREWTAALGGWCDSQPDLVPFRGQCLVHRSQLEQAAGAWSDAAATAVAACKRLADPPHPALGMAQYQRGELHRLRGEFAEAYEAYRLANRAGFQPMPGRALLELAATDPAAAAATIRRALDDVCAPYERPALLAAAVEIFSAAADVQAARRAADELVALAHSASPVLKALADQCVGAVLYAEGDLLAALQHLRAAAASWRRLEMPYEAARTAVMIGMSCAALGDRASAELEFDAARDLFAALEARVDIAALDSLVTKSNVKTSSRSAGRRDERLSAREREVLAHVAAGETNREIADALVISHHTVGRHLENIYSKLGVTSRAAAAAYAVEHDLL